ncbi:SusC/RagA family TonB-linked outer membrane protein [Adhaeribacter aerolatus]|uniref:SusC/RagA family TonB-linked outer membrane protein n=1 Tax=Adhaeribacter aerolatus TaxID=670289 RepID=A0A512AVI3_9BACT|nr:TonB-dependent receptor [Adhaeribacter aerolatus]GEO03724.1 SusC/RagA family TonB-linked outer membrane protein [Adhaeribacter aerolatus]
MRKNILLALTWLSFTIFYQVSGYTKGVGHVPSIVLQPAFKSTPLINKLRIAAKTVQGKVTSEAGETLIGVTVVVKGTTIGTSTDASGNYTIEVPDNGGILVFSYIGFITKEVMVGNATILNVTMVPDAKALEEVVVVGYGTQKKSDITGAVASIPKERLEMVPNLNVAQAIQGAIPGVVVQTTSAGASPNQSIMVRGRNSITANNDPLIVVDGVPYGGQLNDINPNDIQGIEILKDASSAAIYGSRGANGVILITTKEGVKGKPTFSYNGKYSIMGLTNLPDVMDGGEFYKFKMDRRPQHMTEYEKANFEAGKWIDWYDLALRKGASQDHNIAMSGSTENVKYYLSGGVIDVRGLAVKDDFLRATSRINLDVKFTNWLSVGTRTQLSLTDQSGIPANFDDILKGNPLTTPFNEDGTLTIFPWPGNEDHVNALENTVWNNTSKSYQVITNNFALINFPFIPGLSYRLNSGIRMTLDDDATYIGRNSTTGFKERGRSETKRAIFNNTILENILSYSKEFGKHNIFATSVFSFEKNTFNATLINAQGFPHDILTNFSVREAKLIEPNYLYNSTHLISQMLRVNYSFASRYLLTLTARRDGYSGFGSNSKWGTFPSVAVGWNLNEEAFFPWKDFFSNLKLRASWGLNGNQAVGAYQSISRLSTLNMVDAKETVAGYEPSVLGQENLGWESSRTINLGLDFGLLQNRLSGDVNFFKTNTTDLLLKRTISGVHGITSITQNIGETQNTGLELSLNSKNIQTSNFRWHTNGNVSYIKNKIVSLYGQLNEQGQEIDDVANAWFIGQPIAVNYGFEWLGTWQKEEETEAAAWKSQPGFVKLKDVNGDGVLDGRDRTILGQRDPKLLWGLTNSLTYKNFTLNVFVHGVHGVTKQNTLMSDRGTQNEIRRNTIVKDWWTPNNPTNNWVMNNADAEIMSGQVGVYYQNASFIRIKDVSLSYDLPKNFIGKIRLNGVRVFATGRNLYTITKWTNGTDPELNDQNNIPLQKELVFGLNLQL